MKQTQLIWIKDEINQYMKLNKLNNLLLTTHFHIVNAIQYDICKQKILIFNRNLKSTKTEAVNKNVYNFYNKNT